ncbi:MAG: glycoside hydrolase family 5 protein [Anaerolineae bacterium]
MAFFITKNITLLHLCQIVCIALLWGCSAQPILEQAEPPVVQPSPTPPEPISPTAVPTLAPEPTPTVEPTIPAAAVVKPSLKRGVNIAGDFEVFPRGEWGTPIEAYFFDLAAEAGFDHVRIPIRWSAHTGAAPNYLIDEAFFEEVDWLLDQAQRVGLTIVIDTHHFEELNDDPLGFKDELLAIWRQVGARYAGQQATVVFEINNEPTGVFDDRPELWNQIAAEALQVIRETNPNRLAIIGPVGFNHPNRLSELVLPTDDNLLVTVHSYDPIEFTVQGAPWFDPPPATGQVWQSAQPAINYVWQEASWDTQVTPAVNGFQLQFERQYAAFGVQSLVSNDVAFETATVQSDRPFEAVILCNVNESNVIAELSAPTVNDVGDYEMSADISTCGPLGSIAIQLVSEQLVTPVLQRLDLCGSDIGCEKVIVSAEEALNIEMSAAKAWAAGNGVDLYLGEFGVYDHPSAPVDPISRAAWIQAMRQAAEVNGIGWAYFELSSDFGVYDHANQVWRTDMLEALFAPE